MHMHWLPLALVLLVVLPLHAIEAPAGSQGDEHAGHDMSSMQMSNDPCFAYNTSCHDCSMAGCNYCQKVQGFPFCTSAKNSTAAGCAMPGCSSDTFITKLAWCNTDGCNSAYDCEHCVQNPGCGYCQNSGDGNIGCMEAQSDFSAADRCRQNGSYWGMGIKKCSLLCEKRWSRDMCLEPTRPCIWDGTAQKCSFSATGQTQEINIPVAQVTEAPLIEVPPEQLSDSSEGSYSTGLMLVVLGGLVIGALIIKKLR